MVTSELPSEFDYRVNVGKGRYGDRYQSGFCLSLPVVAYRLPKGALLLPVIANQLMMQFIMQLELDLPKSLL